MIELKWEDIETQIEIDLYEKFKFTGIVDSKKLFEYINRLNGIYRYIQISNNDMDKYLIARNKLMLDRMAFNYEFGYPILSTMLLDKLSTICKNKTVVDVGAGSGWLSHQLKLREVNIIAIDQYTKSNSHFTKNHTDILETNAIDNLKYNYFDIVIMTWPDYNCNFAYQILEQLKSNQILIYMGELEGGCTGDDNFFKLLDKKAIENTELTKQLQEHNLCWPGMRDDWYVSNIK